MTLPKVPVSFPPKLDYQKQCVEVPGTKKPGQTGKVLSTCQGHPMLTYSLQLTTETVRTNLRSSVTYAQIRTLGAFPFITLDSPEALKTLHDVFDSGMSRGANGDCLGHRPVISTNPLKFGEQFVWQSWGTIDARKRALGSGLLKLFEDGVIGGGDHRTVGVWSKNCPSKSHLTGCVSAYS